MFSMKKTKPCINDARSHLITILIPVFNEEAVLSKLLQTLDQVTGSMPYKFEFLFVDDGSRDNTVNKLRFAKNRFKQIRILSLSRNFGKEAAVTAGLQYAKGDAVILIDADLQDPPHCIPEMVSAWKQGADVVLMKRRSRHGDGWAKRTYAYLFYRFISYISDIPIPTDTGDFRLMSRQVVDAVNQLPERNRYMKGIFAWVGMDTKIIEFDREQRAAGITKWNYLKLFTLALDGITSFSYKPLRISFFLGIALLATSILSMFVSNIGTTSTHEVIDYNLLFCLITFFFGLQFLCLGVLGEYIGKIYTESKQRPLFIVSEFIESHDDNSRSKQRIINL
jgi:glycosyltransferase involved in cell wall biosynthesis